jgi:hypothetical protein
VLELHHGRVKLPDDFYVFNHALACSKGAVRVPRPQGVNLQQVSFPTFQEQPATIDTCTEGTICPTWQKDAACGGCGSCDICNTTPVPAYNPLLPFGDPCIKPRVFMDCKGDAFELIQIVQTETRTWNEFLPLHLEESDIPFGDHCPNRFVGGVNKIKIKDGFLWSSLKSATIYLNYLGALETADGDLLVVDQEDITMYYEYALKCRILENLLINGEDVGNKIAYFDKQRRNARIEAKNVVNTPNFSELTGAFRRHREAFDIRYVNMFKNYNWISIPYTSVNYGRRFW